MVFVRRRLLPTDKKEAKSIVKWTSPMIRLLLAASFTSVSAPPSPRLWPESFWLLWGILQRLAAGAELRRRLWGAAEEGRTAAMAATATALVLVSSSM